VNVEIDSIQIHLRGRVIDNNVEINVITGRSGTFVNVGRHGDAALFDAAEEGDIRFLESFGSSGYLLQFLDDKILFMAQI
jgi:hypothetical protein